MIKKNGNNEIKTLSHSTYRCQYHIVFAPKYRRKEIYGKIKKDKELYMNYLRVLRNFNLKLEKIATLLLPDVKLSSYTPRHTWATLAFHAGVNIGIICKALGHSSIKVTETYLKPFENEKVDIANDELIISVVAHNGEKEVA